MKTKLLIVGLLVTACGGKYYDPELYGAKLDNQSKIYWASDPNLKSRIKRVIELSSKYWGGQPEDIAGLTIVLTDEDIVGCGFSGGLFDGCTDVFERLVVISTQQLPCIEATSLTHEMGHVIDGDPSHKSKRWRKDSIEPLWNETFSDWKHIDDTCERYYKQNPYVDQWFHR